MMKLPRMVFLIIGSCAFITIGVYSIFSGLYFIAMLAVILAPACWYAGRAHETMQHDEKLDHLRSHIELFEKKLPDMLSGKKPKF